MESKIDTRRMDKRSAKKDRSDGPYSAKHIRHLEQVMVKHSAKDSAKDSAKSAKSINKGRK